MPDATEPVPTPTTDCGELRRRVDAACADVPALRAAALAAAEVLTRTRAALADAESRLAAAQQMADPRAIGEAKAQARRVYRRDYGAAGSDLERQNAATTWLREVDRINRDARVAGQALQATRREVADTEVAVRETGGAADAARIRAETAADACRTARERLAACEEQEARGPAAVERRAATAGRGSPGPAPVETTAARPARAAKEQAEPAVQWAEPPTAPWEAPRAADGPSSSRADDGDEDKPVPPPPPLMIQRLADGDRRALRAVSSELAEATGQESTAFVLLLQELVDGISAVAAAEGFLDFGDEHPFWSQFSRDEVRSVVQALARMGCRYDPRDGFAGRPPGWNEFSLAMAHAGFDLRGLRGLPQGSGFEVLFEGARVAVEELLAERAPQLTLEQVTTLLGPAADGLGDLWDNWGRLRPRLVAQSAT